MMSSTTTEQMLQMIQPSTDYNEKINKLRIIGVLSLSFAIVILLLNLQM